MSLSRFQLDQQAIIDDQICPKCVVYDNAIIFDWDDDLPGDVQSAPTKLRCHQRLIRAFKQARPEVLVQMEATIDNLPGQCLDIGLVLHLRVFM